jgi:hypothetical protein
MTMDRCMSQVRERAYGIWSRLSTTIRLRNEICFVTGRGPVSELADGIRDAASYGDAVVIVLHSSSARAMLSSRALSPYRFSIRVAARQISISGITPGKSHACGRDTFNTHNCMGCEAACQGGARWQRY